MPFLDSVTQFITTYYIDPIINDSGYNVYNTLTWAIILGIAVYVLIYSLQKMKIQVDFKFMGVTLPYIIAGASLRVVADAGAVSKPFSYLLISPNIYFSVFFITLACLVLSLILQKYKAVQSFHLPFLSLGVLFILIVYVILFLNCSIAHFWVPFAVAFVGIGGAVLFGMAAKAAGSQFFSDKLNLTIFSDKLNLTILAAHLMDATSTVIGIEVFGYVEKHVLPAYLIDVTGTALIMYPLKFIVFFAAVWILDVGLKVEEKDKENMNFIKNAIKFVIIILGLGPAIRNSIRLFFGI
ncbi:MAG: DUF63 family protein [Methanimicrococcus sp.]|nr:DUF63 family protein [Methanimicrococcus sp.]